MPGTNVNECAMERKDIRAALAFKSTKTAHATFTGIQALVKTQRPGLSILSWKSPG
jgi:hypothetical protein